MKKTVIMILSIWMLTALLGGCAAQTPAAPAATEAPVATEAPAPADTEAPAIPEATDEPAPTAEPEPDFVTYTSVYTEGITEEPIEFRVLPEGYNSIESEHKGTDVVIHYTTDAYEDGKTYEKFCRVYLPYGYDENDKDTKYNVIYYQHGHQGSPNEMFDHDMKKLHALNLLNNIFDPDHQVMEPCIIVCPTYYFEYDESAYVTPGDNPAGDGNTEGIPANYHIEVIEDLIPAVESQFNVYCEDFSKEGIKATRDHRAWTGYSRGSMCTFYMFHNDFEYFAYWMPVSAPCLPQGMGTTITPEEAFAYLKEPIDANPELDFFLFASTGSDKDQAGLALVGQAEYFAKQTDVFSFGPDPAVNNFYFMRSDYLHNSLYYPYTLANAANILFH